MIKPTWEKLITWQQREIKPAWQAWLLHTGSFMQRLVQHGVNNARIKVLSQRWRLSNFEQSALLSVGFKTPVLVRDALIVNHNQFWMFARTVIPRHTLTGEEQVLAHLKERSLGSVLFKNPALQRSEFEIAYLQPTMFLHAKATNAMQQSLPNLWARRSLFSLPEKSLILTEVFLPDIAML